MKIAAVARYLRALGYETKLTASPVTPGLPALPRESRRRAARSRNRQWPNVATLRACRNGLE